METVVRLHRAGEGAAYTGLKPGDIDYGPVIPAAEQAVETGDLTKLKAVLVEQIEHVLRERLAHVRELQKVPGSPRLRPKCRLLGSGSAPSLALLPSLKLCAGGTRKKRRAPRRLTSSIDPTSQNRDNAAI